MNSSDINVLILKNQTIILEALSKLINKLVSSETSMFDDPFVNQLDNYSKLTLEAVTQIENKKQIRDEETQISINDTLTDSLVALKKLEMKFKDMTIEEINIWKSEHPKSSIWIDGFLKAVSELTEFADIFRRKGKRKR